MLSCAGSWDHLCVDKAPADDTEPGEQSGSRAASGAPAPSGRRAPAAADAATTATDAATAAAPEPEKPHERASEAAHAVEPTQGRLAVAILIVVLRGVLS